MSRTLQTSKGTIEFPVYMPVTTYGKYPIDDLIRPYLPRFTQCIMVSHHYAQAMKTPPEIPLFIDSGGFSSLFADSQIIVDGDFATIRTGEDTSIDPESVLQFQIQHAQVGATLDFVITPTHDLEEAQYRQGLTIQNAIWAVEQDRPDDFHLFASVQAWDRQSAISCMERIAQFDFAGFALGGMVPRVSDPKRMLEIVDAIREVDQRPLHVFGVGKPALVRDLFNHNVDSVDSSTFVQNAVSKRFFRQASDSFENVPDSVECSCHVCRCLEPQYLQMDGELNSLALSLHNLHHCIASIK